jgi:hypothetical protein
MPAHRALRGEGRDEQNLEEAKMFSKSRCPHTGVVNFFTRADPLLAIGSIAVPSGSARYVWRCYLGEETSGLERDMPAAEARLKTAVARVERQRDVSKSRKPVMATLPSRSSSCWQKLNAAAAAISRNSPQ